MSFPFLYAIITSAKEAFTSQIKEIKFYGPEIINQRKKKKKLTNEELSVLSGVPKGTIDKITSGATKDPKLETLKALARVLDCSLADFDDPKERHFAERTDQEVLQNRIHILTEYFQRMGILQPGGDISGQDLEFFKGLLSLIDAYFGKKEEADR